MGFTSLHGESYNILRMIDKQATDQVESFRDRLGKPVDPGIKPVVISLISRGFRTTASCEGHVGRKTGGPYVVLESPQTDEYIVKMKTVEFGGVEFKALRSELEQLNLAERDKVSELLDKFYAKHPGLERLEIKNIGPGTTKLIYPGSAEAEAAGSERHDEWLRRARGEFDSFAAWLTAD